MTETTLAGPVSVGVRDLKAHLSEHLRRVKGGQEITVTEHGQPVATLRPLGGEVDRLAALVAAGIIRPAKSRVRALPSERIRLDGGGSLVDDVLAQRR